MLKSLIKKTALMIPYVQRLQQDLHNRRLRADEFEAANKILVKRNEELLENIEFMKNQMSKALSLKDTAILAESSVASKAEHYHGQLAILNEKHNNLMQKYEDLETQSMILTLTNEKLLKNIQDSSASVRTTTMSVKKTHSAEY